MFARINGCSHVFSVPSGNIAFVSRSTRLCVSHASLFNITPHNLLSLSSYLSHEPMHQHDDSAYITIHCAYMRDVW